MIFFSSLSMFSFRALSIFMKVVSLPNKSYVWASSAMISVSLFCSFHWVIFSILFLMPCNFCFENWTFNVVPMEIRYLFPEFSVFFFILIVKGYRNSLLSEFSKLLLQRLYSLSCMVIEISVPLVHVQLIIGQIVLKVRRLKYQKQKRSTHKH